MIEKCDINDKNHIQYNVFKLSRTAVFIEIESIDSHQYFNNLLQT